MQWLEITINSSHEAIYALEARLLELGVSGVITEDEAEISEFLKENRKYWDYVDESFMDSMKNVCRVKFYLEDTEDGHRELLRISESMPEVELISSTVRDEDWENSWRAYYKPVKVGGRLLIVPEWEQIPEAEGCVVLRLDPGLIFGTGTHATTQLCLRELERTVFQGASVLDLGCGSGILAIASLLLGAGCATGCDIDDKAPSVVMSNAALNGIGEDRLSVFCGDVLSDRALSGMLGEKRFDLVLSNIVADVIIALSEIIGGRLGERGVWICSGIIDGREAEVEAALDKNGFTVFNHTSQDGWHAFTCGRRENG